MGTPAEAATNSGSSLIGRDADLATPSFYSPAPITGSQYVDPVDDFQSNYYSGGGQLLNPSYAGAPLYTPQPAPAMFAPYQTSNYSLPGANSYLSSPAPIITPPSPASVASQGWSTPTMSGGFQASQSGVNKLVDPKTTPGAGSTSGGGQPISTGGDSEKPGKTGVGDSVINTIFGKDSPILKTLLGGAAAIGAEKLVKTPTVPDYSTAYQQIMTQGPQTQAGQIADRQMLDYLQRGPEVTPISKEYLMSISKMFDDEMENQLKNADTRMQAAGAGGFGGGSGDAQHMRADIINKYSLEKTYYMQKLLDERMRADVSRYYDTLNKVYGVSHEELKAMADMEVQELAAMFQIEYADANELKSLLGQMIHEATSPTDPWQEMGKKFLGSISTPGGV